MMSFFGSLILFENDMLLLNFELINSASCKSWINERVLVVLDFGRNVLSNIYLSVELSEKMLSLDFN